MDLPDLSTNKLSDEDRIFLENVIIDVRSYVNRLNSGEDKNKVLLFPPVNNFRRFLVHQLVEKAFRKDKISTLSIGSLEARRTVVLPATLKLMANNKGSSRTPEQATCRISNDSSSKNRTKKNKKPDVQIYVPRGRRLLQAGNDRNYENEWNDASPANTSFDTSLNNSCYTEDTNQTLDESSENCDTSISDISVPISEEKAKSNTNCDLQEEIIDLDSPDVTVVDENVIVVTDDDDEPTSLGHVKRNNSILNSPLKYSTDSQPTPVTNVNKMTKPLSKSKAEQVNVDECDWNDLFDESGDFINKSLMEELMTAIGKVSVARASQDYRPFQTVEERSSDGGCIIELYGFSADFKTDDLMAIFTPYRVDQTFQLVWVDDTHALAMFSSPLLADEVLNTELPFVKTRPLKNAVPKSKMKARNLIQQPATRPKTCVSLARRLVSGHLGMKINVPPRQREAERKLLSDAREEKRLVAKQKYDA